MSVTILRGLSRHDLPNLYPSSEGPALRGAAGPGADQLRDNRRTRRTFHLFHNMLDMGLDGRLGDSERIADFLVREPLGERVSDLALTMGQAESFFRIPRLHDLFSNVFEDDQESSPFDGRVRAAFEG